MTSPRSVLNTGEPLERLDLLVWTLRQRCPAYLAKFLSSTAIRNVSLPRFDERSSEGWSSPVVSGNEVWLTSGSDEKRSFARSVSTWTAARLSRKLKSLTTSRRRKSRRTRAAIKLTARLRRLLLSNKVACSLWVPGHRVSRYGKRRETLGATGPALRSNPIRRFVAYRGPRFTIRCLRRNRQTVFRRV